MADELTRGERPSANPPVNIARCSHTCGYELGSQFSLVGALLRSALGVQMLQRLDVDFAAL